MPHRELARALSDELNGRGLPHRYGVPNDKLRRMPYEFPDASREDFEQRFRSMQDAAAAAPPRELSPLELVQASVKRMADELERLAAIEAVCRELMATVSIPRNRETMATAEGLAEFFKLVDGHFSKQLERLKPASV